MNTVEMNKMIAEFEYGSNDWQLLSTRYGLFPATLDYHENWVNLMPVLEMIPKLNPQNGKLHFEWQISRCHCHIWSNKGLDIRINAGTTQNAVYQAVCKFIQWYSSLSKGGDGE